MIFNIIFLVFVIHRNEAQNCNEFGSFLYDELKCIPEYDHGNDCPVRYDCEYERSTEGCRFQGQTYDVGSSLPEDKTAYNVECYCERQYDSDIPLFTCALLECPEFFGVSPAPDCYREYELGTRCSIGEICPPYDRSEICIVDGELHRQGQRFYPKDMCIECICDRQYNETFDGPNCRSISCATELKYGIDIEENCAPIYYKRDDDNVLCCPENFLCYDGTENIYSQRTEENVNPKLNCKYGPLILAHGEYFSKQYKQYGATRILKCSCDLPPLVTCIGNA